MSQDGAELWVKPLTNRIKRCAGCGGHMLMSCAYLPGPPFPGGLWPPPVEVEPLDCRAPLPRGWWSPLTAEGPLSWGVLLRWATPPSKWSPLTAGAPSPRMLRWRASPPGTWSPLTAGMPLLWGVLRRRATPPGEMEPLNCRDLPPPGVALLIGRPPGKWSPLTAGAPFPRGSGAL